ncbi:uncharacterized protein LOC107621356 [Arachis ipaensis]|nr:uncharacterized protein LOC107621356 [Arachis ipaensis]XP_025685635.1 uncharacterized protein LOC112786477 [Arachis hypogaea]XP_025685637.1 uncharacterized protein LOC112786480 [Arachis hypogaea]QHN83781.1 putative protein-like [Arachis hypogaea]
MEAGNGGRGGGVSLFSNGSNGSSASMRTRRKTHEESCFCGLKAAIRKSGTTENPDRLFRACPRYQKGSHCNYFKWVEDDEYEGVGQGGTKKDYGAELQVDSDCDEWRLKVAWRLGSLEAEVKALKMLIVFLFVVVVLNVIVCSLLSRSK